MCASVGKAKKCTKCGEVKDESKFPWRGVKHEKRYAQCRICRAIIQARWWQEHRHECRDERRRYIKQYKKQNPIKYRRITQNANLKKDFGITIKQYEAMLFTQNDVCAICGRRETATFKGKVKQLAVDHNHATDKNRALLCTKCNTGLGGFEDDPERLEKAAAYLRYHEKVT